MSGGLCPSKSTVYVSNLPYCLTNNDLHKIFEKFGKLGKVTIVKDKKTRESRGVAFVLFVERSSANKAVHIMNNRELFGRTLKCSIAKDNGRAPEFIKRKIYKDKSFCYECGEHGHLSYKCPKNALGERDQPQIKKKKKKKKDVKKEESYAVSDDDDTIDDDISLSDAIKLAQQEREIFNQSLQRDDITVTCDTLRRKTIKPDTYFSDEDASD